MNTQHDEVATVLSTWTAAEMSGDANTIGELLADDFTAFGPLGFALSKKDWLERHKAGALEYETFALEELEFRRYDGVAVATARETGTCTYNGHPVPGELRVTIVLTDQAGAWQLALIHMSFIAGTPGAPPDRRATVNSYQDARPRRAERSDERPAKSVAPGPRRGSAEGQTIGVCD
jgi:ketosteroid isomerase-like protein